MRRWLLRDDLRDNIPAIRKWTRIDRWDNVEHDGRDRQELSPLLTTYSIFSAIIYFVSFLCNQKLFPAIATAINS